jgi:chemotaxis protein MotA
MDKLSLLGLLVAFSGIIGGSVMEGGSVVLLLQGAALLIVLGGTLGAVMLQNPARTFGMGLRMGRWAFSPPRIQSQKMVYQLSAWSNVARRDSVLKLEDQIDEISDPFVRKGLQLLVDGSPAEKIRDVMQVELQTYEQCHYQAARVWESAAGYAPTIGIMGAVLGLVQVMQNLRDPAALGMGIAVAFISTLYGVGLANLVFLPVSGKLKQIIQQQVYMREMFIDGLMMIANGENTRHLETKLQGYIPA